MLKHAAEFRRARVTQSRTLYFAPATPVHEKFYGR